MQALRKTPNSAVKPVVSDQLSAFMAQSLDWSVWIGLLIVVTALGLAARSAGSHSSTLRLQSDPYGTGYGTDANGSASHSRVETGS